MSNENDFDEKMKKFAAIIKNIEEKIKEQKTKCAGCDVCKSYKQNVENLCKALMMLAKEQSKEISVLEKLLNEAIDAIEKIYDKEEEDMLQ